MISSQQPAWSVHVLQLVAVTQHMFATSYTACASVGAILIVIVLAQVAIRALGWHANFPEANTNLGNEVGSRGNGTAMYTAIHQPGNCVNAVCRTLRSLAPLDGLVAGGHGPETADGTVGRSGELVRYGCGTHSTPTYWPRVVVLLLAVAINRNSMLACSLHGHDSGIAYPLVLLSEARGRRWTVRETASLLLRAQV
jgi:hypothetical protein